MDTIRKTLLPAAFVAPLASTVYYTLSAWLKANAPDDVAQLFRHYEGLTNYVHQVERGQIRSLENYGIVDHVVEVAQVISRLGGEFAGPDGPCAAQDYPAIESASDLVRPLGYLLRGRTPDELRQARTMVQDLLSAFDAPAASPYVHPEPAPT